MKRSQLLNWRMRAACIGWLRYERQCHLAFWERSPFPDHRYIPDLIAINRSWKVIEVELKQSIHDFKANDKKRGITVRYYFPAQFYFCVPRELVERVKPLMRKGIGLLTLKDKDDRFGPQIEVITAATTNREATPISKFAVARMVAHQTASLHRACVALSKTQNTLRDERPEQDDLGIVRGHQPNGVNDSLLSEPDSPQANRHRRNNGKSASPA